MIILATIVDQTISLFILWLLVSIAVAGLSGAMRLLAQTNETDTFQYLEP